MAYVITCGDEGVQINVGTRLGVVGAGYKLPGFSEVVKILKKIFEKDLRIAASEENDWLKAQFNLAGWDQVNASAQQHIEALADKEKLLYAGYLPFSDPRQLKHDIKGHMVRPHKIHIANKISFSLGGGEQTYNLGHFQVSADWVAEADEKLAKSFLGAQVEFYEKLVGGNKLERVVEVEGDLGEEVAAKNEAVLKKLGLI